jgi:rhodanese-related sulfurtransferase
MYFPRSAAKNLEGSQSLDDLPEPEELSTDEVMNFKGVVLDVRTNAEYGVGHVSNSLNIGLGGQFASWAGTLIPIGTPIAVVANSQDQVNEAVMRLARVGHEAVHGFILFENYTGRQKAVAQVSVTEVNNRLAAGDKFQFVDVRRLAEHKNAHARKAINMPLSKLGEDLNQLDPAEPTYVICQGGYRSSIGTGILENAGFNQLFNVTGGSAAWIAAGLPIEGSETTYSVT